MVLIEIFVELIVCAFDGGVFFDFHGSFRLDVAVGLGFSLVEHGFEFADWEEGYSK